MAGVLHRPEDTHNEATIKVKGNVPMKVTISHTKVKLDKRDEINAAGKRVLEALERERPQGVLYAVCPLPDGENFVTLLITDDGVDNPIQALPEYRAFAENFKTWIAEPPTAEQLTAASAYRSF
jgi:hypothetical protein